MTRGGETGPAKTGSRGPNAGRSGVKQAAPKPPCGQRLACSRRGSGRSLGALVRGGPTDHRELETERTQASLCRPRPPPSWPPSPQRPLRCLSPSLHGAVPSPLARLRKPGSQHRLLGEPPACLGRPVPSRLSWGQACRGGRNGHWNVSCSFPSGPARGRQATPAPGRPALSAPGRSRRERGRTARGPACIARLQSRLRPSLGLAVHRDNPLASGAAGLARGGQVLA